MSHDGNEITSFTVEGCKNLYACVDVYGYTTAVSISGGGLFIVYSILSLNFHIAFMQQCFYHSMELFENNGGKTFQTHLKGWHNLAVDKSQLTKMTFILINIGDCYPNIQRVILYSRITI